MNNNQDTTTNDIEMGQVQKKESTSSVEHCFFRNYSYVCYFDCFFGCN